MAPVKESSVTATQVSLFQLDNYGPWTVTPEPRREPDLQALQARLYADVSEQVGTRSGYAFFTRFDNMIAVTNGLDIGAHRSIQRSIANRYPVTTSIGIGYGSTPVDALSEATEAVQAAGSAQDENRSQVLSGTPLPADEQTTRDVRIAHFDVIDATGKYTDQLNAFDSYMHIERTYSTLMSYLRNRYDSLSFFVGGDNIIAVCSSLDESDIEATISHVESEAGVELQVGIGQGQTAVEAGMTAKHALEECRHNDTRIEGHPAAVIGD
jgi:GTP cyclohydrolase IIa